MTDRHPETGRFLSDHYAAEHSKLEFTPLPDEKEHVETNAPEYGSSDAEIRAAAAEMVERRGLEIEEPETIIWKDSSGNPLSGEFSTTDRQGATALADYRQQKDEAAQAELDRALKTELDNVRIETQMLNPQSAAKYEFGQELTSSLEEYARENGLPGPGDVPPAHTAETNTRPAATPDGLEQQLAFAMSHPQVREAIEVELAQAHQAKADYEAKVNEANAWARGALIHEFSELGRLPVDQWENALMTIQAQDPVRFQRGVSVIDQVQRVSAEQARIANEHAARAQQMESARQQQLEQWSRAEGTKYDAWAKAQGLDMGEVAPAVARYIATDLNLSRDQFNQILRDNPVLRSAEFQKTITLAAKQVAAQEARKNIERTPLPPAIRPGAQPPSGASSHSSNAGQIAEVSRRLSNASGMQAVRLAAKLTSLKRGN
jgi:hypothetical protein